MTCPSPEPSLTPPDWPYCGHGATTEDPVGCRGIRIPGHTSCLAHLADADRDAYLAGPASLADADFTGTPFSPGLLRQLLQALHTPDDRFPFVSAVRFDHATFTGDVWFDDMTFPSDVSFEGAAFTGATSFDGVTFTSDAFFERATFGSDVSFLGVTFTGGAFFQEATFTGDTSFDDSDFHGGADFGWAAFAGETSFQRALFRDASFKGARFEAESLLGPLACGSGLQLDGAVFTVPVIVEAVAPAVTCVRTRWASAATLHLRYAELDLRDAVLEFPLTVSARSTPFSSGPGDPLPETLLSGHDPGVRLTSIDGVDAAHLALYDIDLTDCRFAGAVHLDQLRVDGWCTFANTPGGIHWHRLLPRWWGRRSTLAEEHHWRAQCAPAALAQGWTSPPADTPVLRPAALAALYRQARKSLEDGKNEPDAADFYYGEMEMRRHDTTRSPAERALLTAYWAVSGYGLRASRALAWLLGAMATTLLALLLWGLPAADPKPTTTGRQAAVGQEVTLTTDTPDPVNPTGPWSERVTTERFEKALRVVINSVVFRSSGQSLTTAGTYTEMTSRIAEPILLGLAVLAVRGRVKR